MGLSHVQEGREYGFDKSRVDRIEMTAFRRKSAANRAVADVPGTQTSVAQDFLPYNRYP
jgi:hypothetical protein